MTKSEFYKMFIEVQKKTGQGLSGIVKVLGKDPAKFTKYLNEFIEEGLIKACDTGGSMGHPESNIFYMPTKGYNVWEDNGTDGEQSRFGGRYLTYVRYYLGILEPKMKSLVEDEKHLPEYNEWLEINKKSLEEMKNLEEDYEKCQTIKQ